MRLGIDLGGTKTAAIVLDDRGRTVWEQRKPTPRNDYDATIELIAGLVAEGERAAASRCSVGIGMPGAISPATGLVKNANSTWLNSRALRQDIERRLGRGRGCLRSDPWDRRRRRHRRARAAGHGRECDSRRVGPQRSAVA